MTISISNDSSNNHFIKSIGIGGVPGDGQNGSGSYVLGHGAPGEGDDEYLQLEDGGASLQPNDDDDGMGIDDSPSFDPSDGMEAGMDAANTNDMGKSGEFGHNYQHQSNMNEEEEEGRGGDGFSNGVVLAGVDENGALLEGEMSPEVEAITRQATNQLNTALDETRDLACALFKELTIFLNEAVAVQKDFEQVQMAVKTESERLDNLEPAVENATHEILIQAQASSLH